LAAGDGSGARGDQRITLCIEPLHLAVHSLDPGVVGSGVDDQLADERRHTEMRC
jgi:hypothetical protein